MSHPNTPSELRAALPLLPGNTPALDSERLDTALRLVLNALDADHSSASIVSINRTTLCRDLATALRLDTSQTDKSGGQ